MMILFVTFWAFVGFVAVFFAIGDAVTRVVQGWASVDSE